MLNYATVTAKCEALRATAELAYTAMATARRESPYYSGKVMTATIAYNVANERYTEYLNGSEVDQVLAAWQG